MNSDNHAFVEGIKALGNPLVSKGDKEWVKGFLFFLAGSEQEEDFVKIKHRIMVEVENKNKEEVRSILAELAKTKEELSDRILSVEGIR